MSKLFGRIDEQKHLAQVFEPIRNIIEDDKTQNELIPSALRGYILAGDNCNTIPNRANGCAGGPRRSVIRRPWHHCPISRVSWARVADDLAQVDLQQALVGTLESAVANWRRVDSSQR